MDDLDGAHDDTAEWVADRVLETDICRRLAGER
jgi:hypothetical protein